MQLKSNIRSLLFLVAFGLLSACENSQERAEKHFQSALALLAAGDEERAIVEFRNVFQLNESHHEARSKFAALQRQRGNTRAAIGQYLQLVERFPDDFEGQKAISEIYANIGDWEEMRRHLAPASALNPNDKVIQALQAMSDYQLLADGDDPASLAEVVVRVEVLVAELPDYILLHQILIDNHVRSANYEEALAQLDDAIAVSPLNRRLHIVRLSVLSSLGDAFGVETQLRDMIAKFPDDETSRQSLVRWYVSQGQLDDAENYMREVAELIGASLDDRLALIQFLSQVRGEDKALRELNRLVAAGSSEPMILGLRSGFEFDRGNHDLAIGQLRGTLAVMTPSEDARRLTVALAKMLQATGELAAARDLIEVVLAEDRSNVPALKMHAEFLIGADRASEAVLSLRSALDQEPRDAAILTLLARAYERDGNQDLVGEMLALAMAASDGAPLETVQYAQHLFLLKKYRLAENILVDSLRLAPGDLPILAALGTVYVQTEDWPRAEQVQATLRRLGTEQAAVASNDLQARILQGKKELDKTIAFLESLIDQGEAGFGANLAIARSYLAAGEQQKAKVFVAELVRETPNDPALRFLSASVDLATGELERAESEFRRLISEDGSRLQVWVALFRLLSSTDRASQAAAVIDDAMLAVPNEPTLQWIKASILENDGDVEGAIALYEEMYAVNSGDLIVANNLASLLSTAHDDPTSLDRAALISRRLRSSDIAPFQDTFGWIAFLRGEISTAVTALEPAAEGLGGDPMVQYHLARAYLASDNPNRALAQFNKVVILAGAADTRDFVLEARQEIYRLNSDGGLLGNE